MMTKEFSREALQVMNSTLNDLDFTFTLFESAIDYQNKNGYELWPQFSRELIETEIAEKRHWKMQDGKTITCVFSVLYNDPVIWSDRDVEPAVYLHRIAVNPVYKGKEIMKAIRTWAIQHARERQKNYVRMDTWGNNVKLREYYINCGFNYIGQHYLEEVDDLPAHYGGSVLSLFQIEV